MKNDEKQVLQSISEADKPLEALAPIKNKEEPKMRNFVAQAFEKSLKDYDALYQKLAK